MRPARWLVAVGATAVVSAVGAPSASAAEAATPQAVDANAEFLAYAPPPPVPAKVCVVDTGVDLSTDAAPAVVERHSVFGGTTDDVGGSGLAKHGTLVAGVIASQLDGRDSVGIWPQARIVSGAGVCGEWGWDDGGGGSSRSSEVPGARRERREPVALWTRPARPERSWRSSRTDRGLRRTCGSTSSPAPATTAARSDIPARFPPSCVGAGDVRRGALCSFSNRGQGSISRRLAATSSCRGPEVALASWAGTLVLDAGRQRSAWRRFAPIARICDAPSGCRDAALERTTSMPGGFDAAAAFTARRTRRLVATSPARALATAGRDASSGSSATASDSDAAELGSVRQRAACACYRRVPPDGSRSDSAYPGLRTWRSFGSDRRALHPRQPGCCSLRLRRASATRRASAIDVPQSDARDGIDVRFATSRRRPSDDELKLKVTRQRSRRILAGRPLGVSSPLSSLVYRSACADRAAPRRSAAACRLLDRRLCARGTLRRDARARDSGRTTHGSRGHDAAAYRVRAAAVRASGQ